MDIDKLIPETWCRATVFCFGSLMDIDKLIPEIICCGTALRFGSLMDIDKLILKFEPGFTTVVLVL